MEIRRNPLLAIVGNPGRQVHPLAFEARDRYRADMRAGHDDAAEYWRGQAGAFFTGNNPLGPIAYYPVRDQRTRELLGAVYSDDLVDAAITAEEEFGHGAPARPYRWDDFKTTTGLAYPSLKRLIEREGMPPAGPVPGKRIGYYAKGGPLYGKNPRRDSRAEEELDLAEAQLALAERRGRASVAGSKSRSKLKSKGKKKVHGNPNEKKKQRPKTTRYSLEEARKKFKGIDAAIKAYKRFHGSNNPPTHVTVYHLPDGSSEARVENVHAALHRTLETPYVVPWKSSKRGTLWLHEHPEGEGAPLEVLDPSTGTTRKIGGDFVVDDWWHS